MINFSVNYIKNTNAGLLEQAAGFPPFTRGYASVDKSTRISKESENLFALTDYSYEEIIQLFSQIISSKAKGKISLNLPFRGTVEEVIAIRVLRTLLAFTSDKIHNNATTVQFEFYGDHKNKTASLNTLLYANAAQIDNLLVDNINDWVPIKQLLPQTPTDSLYGSTYLEKETSTLFFSLWKQIEDLLV